MRANILRLLKSPTIWIVFLILLVLETVVVFGFYSVERSRLHAVERDITYTSDRDEQPAKHFWKFEMPGLQEPQIILAQAAKLPDAEVVIGVVVNRKPRAYWLKALKYPPWHIVNDVVAGVPLSVTYCDRNDCARLYERKVVDASGRRPRRTLRPRDGRESRRRPLPSRDRRAFRGWPERFVAPLRESSVGAHDLEGLAAAAPRDRGVSRPGWNWPKALTDSACPHAPAC